MTAQVAVMNQHGVALASDSAVTLAGLGKVLEASKLFRLSKHHPVGVMVYNAGSFMGVPWETIIKMYREASDTRARPKVIGYLHGLLEFAQETVPTDFQQEDAFLQRLAEGVLKRVFDRALNLAKMSPAPVTPEFLNYGPASILEDLATRIRASPQKWSTCKADLDSALERIGSGLNSLIEEGFRSFARDLSVLSLSQQVQSAWQSGSALPAAIKPEFRQAPDATAISDPLRLALHDLIRQEIMHGGPSESFTGIVAAGFGKDAVFPELVDAHVDGTVGGKLRTRWVRDIAITRHQSGAIVPFAQTNEVSAFMNGISDDLKRYLLKAVPGTLAKFGSKLFQRLGVLESAIQDFPDETIHKAAQEHAESFFTDLFELSARHHSSPIVKTVLGLPKHELANMAEALVSITAFKRRVSPGEHSVGGPVDVALISRGDGFTWVKRRDPFGTKR